MTSGNHGMDPLRHPMRVRQELGASRPPAAPVVELSQSRTSLHYPFTLGIASGDPLPGRIVLWTRLAPAPAQPDGGMSERSRAVQWEVAADDGFRRVVARGTCLAHAHFAHSVHADVRGLVPGGVYWYRFKCAGHLSETGCLRTAPALEGPQEGVRFALVAPSSDAQFQPAIYDSIARADLDFLVWVAPATRELAPPGEDYATLLASQRARHARSLSCAKQRAARHVLPWIVALDHAELAVWSRAAALQTLWEHAPLRRSRLVARAHFGFGNLAELQLNGEGLASRVSQPTGGARFAWTLLLAAASGPHAHATSSLAHTDAGGPRWTKPSNPVLLGADTSDNALTIIDLSRSSLHADRLMLTEASPCGQGILEPCGSYALDRGAPFPDAG